MKVSRFRSAAAAALLAAAFPAAAADAADAPATRRPNLLLAIADDWGFPHAGAYGDAVVKTPAFDRLAREGVLFTNAYTSSPSCTPSRGALLTGQWHWRLRGAANLWSIFPDAFAAYPEILAKAGYVVGSTGKAWGPGRTETPGRALAGAQHKSFQDFLSRRAKDAPFCFWLGSGDPHRPYVEGSGAAAGIPLDRIAPPACFPDSPEVRGDIADYYFEVQRFDDLVGRALASLEAAGELDKTLVVVTSDNGMPFPRCKSAIYDTGVRMPLAIRWPAGSKGGRRIDDFVSLTDIAPTFLAAAGLAPPADMTGRSLLPLLRAEGAGRIDPGRDFVLFGKERHVPSQERPDMGGYPCRAIRTHEFLYIRNFTPERWPSGTPNHERASFPRSWYADCDNGPTKAYMIEQRDKDAAHRRLYDLAFAKRPAEELYDLRTDPAQRANIAADPARAEIRTALAARLTELLRASGDPRVVGGAEVFESHPYLGGGVPYEEPRKK